MQQSPAADAHQFKDGAKAEGTPWWSDWRTVCPRCRSPGLAFSDFTAQCAGCGYLVRMVDGIWHFVIDERLQSFHRFLDTYTRVRVAEGRASYDVPTLQSLPLCPSGHPLSGQWSIRAKSFMRLLRLLRQQLRRNDRVLDLGAGTGWLSHQLDAAGYRPCAIDLSVDAADGLGASRHFAGRWPRLQAEFDDLPLADSQGHCAIFNASFHYCTDQQRAIGEALRVLVPGGLVIILDTPIYSNEASGRQMLEEQQLYFERLIGERSDSIAASGFLDWNQLDGLAKTLGISWRYERTWYGLRWAMRPLLARLRGRREPATFSIAWARKA